jgi:hypothetical protein
MVFSENGLPPKIQGSKTSCSVVKWQFQQGKKILLGQTNMGMDHSQGFGSSLQLLLRMET